MERVCRMEQTREFSSEENREPDEPTHREERDDELSAVRQRTTPSIEAQRDPGGENIGHAVRATVPVRAVRLAILPVVAECEAENVAGDDVAGRGGGRSAISDREEKRKAYHRDNKEAAEYTEK